jgi:hypothetical protein
MPKKSQPVKLLVLTALTGLLLAGCGNARSEEDQKLIDSLNAKNKELQTENASLRRKLTSKEAYKELMTAMTGHR